MLGGTRTKAFLRATRQVAACAVALGMIWAWAGAAGAQDDQTAERLTEMARKFAGDGADSVDATPGNAVPGVAVSPVEHTPLGGAPKERPAGPNDALGKAEGGEPGLVADAVSEPRGGSWGGSGALATLSALGVVIGLIFLFRWGVAKVSGTPIATASAAVEVLSRSSVAPRSHVLLLRIGPRVLVVGESSGGLRTLSEVTDEQEVANLLQAVESAKPQSIAGGFGTLLGRFNRQYDADGTDAQGATPIDRLAEGRDLSEAPVDRARDSLASLSARLKLRSSREGASS